MFRLWQQKYEEGDSSFSKPTYKKQDATLINITDFEKLTDEELFDIYFHNMIAGDWKTVMEK